MINEIMLTILLFAVAHYCMLLAAIMGNRTANRYMNWLTKLLMK